MSARALVQPLPFVVYAILFAYANTIDFAPPVPIVLLWIAVGGLAAAALSWMFGWLLDDRDKGAVAASAAALMFFSYGHVRDLLGGPLDDVSLVGVGVGPQKVLAVVSAIICVVGWRWLKRASPEAIRIVSRVCTRLGAVLVAIGVATLAAVSASGPDNPVGGRAASTRARPGDAPAAAAPDIYYIVLDDYARADILRDVYSFDNGAFIEWLRQTGFYVADESRANYLQTMLSLASSLNSTYLDPAELAAGGDSNAARWHVAVNVATSQFLDAARRPLIHMIQYSRAVRVLKARGYRFIALTSGYGGVQLPNADLVLRGSRLSDFDESLMATTPLGELERLFDPVELHRRNVLYALDHLADPLAGAGPHFVLAHIMSPHPPFVFTPYGTPASVSDETRHVILSNDVGGTAPADRETVARAYRDQVRFVNARVRRAIETILARSAAPPIIILQGDHGSDMLLDWWNPSAAGLRERTAILNAYYVPAAMRAQLYPRISPVNTFRVVLGRLFGEESALLPDESYFSTYRTPLQLTPIDDRTISVAR
jgi:hypothetical protein